MITAAIGIGANLGNPKHQVVKAIQLLNARYHLRACSSLYQTAPLGWEDQPPFINAVMMIEVGSDALDLLKALQSIESELGRSRKAVTWGESRAIDLDLLLFGSQVINHPLLRVPHPYLKQRRFVLEPLFEIAPSLVLPDGESVANLMQSSDLKSQKIKCIEKLAVL